MSTNVSAIQPDQRRSVVIRPLAAIVIILAAGGAWLWLDLRTPATDAVHADAVHANTVHADTVHAGAVMPVVAAAPAMAQPQVAPPALPQPAQRAKAVAAAAPAPPAQPEIAAAAPAASAPVSLPIPLPAPMPVPTPDQAPAPPSFDIVRVDPHGGAVLAGRAPPDSQVVVASNGQAIATAHADADGQWVAVPSRPLAAGGQELTLTTHGAGGSSTQSASPLIVVVPNAAKPSQPPAATAFALVTPPGEMPRLLQAPGAQPRNDGRLGLDIVDYDEHGAIRFAGAAPPRSSVQVYIDQHPVGLATADPHGRWTLLPSDTVAAGEHRLRVDQLAANGGTSARVELPFRREVITASDAVPGRVVVQPRQNLWRIARHAYGHGIRYTVIYQANREQIRNADLIYPGQVFTIPPASPNQIGSN